MLQVALNQAGTGNLKEARRQALEVSGAAQAPMPALKAMAHGSISRNRAK